MCYLIHILFLAFSCLAGIVRCNNRPRYPCSMHNVWEELLIEIEHVNHGSSVECIYEHHTGLCVPKEMLKTVRNDKAAILQMLNELHDLFMNIEVPFPHVERFLTGLAEAKAKLSDEVGPQKIQISEQTIVTCYKEMKHYLMSKSNSRCAWEKVHAHSREILQRINNVTPCK